MYDIISIKSQIAAQIVAHIVFVSRFCYIFVILFMSFF